MKTLSVLLIVGGTLAAILTVDAIMFSWVLFHRRGFEAAMAMSGSFYAAGILATLAATVTSAMLIRRHCNEPSAEVWPLGLCALLIIAYVAIMSVHPQAHR